MAGEAASSRSHGVAETEADVFSGGKTEGGLGSSPSRHEDETRPSSSRSLPLASASDVSFRSSVASSPSSSFSFGSDWELDDSEAMYRRVQSEYEEIPSFRWIASPLRWWGRRKKTHLSNKSSAADAASRSGDSGLASNTEVVSGGPTRAELVHFDGHLVFTFEDLMKADKEVLGRRTYGTVFRATLGDGHQVAVKRLRGEIARNFEAEANALGKIRHPNILALRAYYSCPEDEKVLVFDYMQKGSLSDFLHARGAHTTIDSTTRMNIALGITRGLHYLHTQGSMVHGNLTSGNILLDGHTNAKIADYGLSHLMITTPNSKVTAKGKALGYDAPELSLLKKANTKTDVYSLGVIMLELLTRKSPWDAIFIDGLDLPQSVDLMMRDRVDLGVLDTPYRPSIRWDPAWTRERELVNTLAPLALSCVRDSPNARPQVLEVLQKLEKRF